MFICIGYIVQDVAKSNLMPFVNVSHPTEFYKQNLYMHMVPTNSFRTVCVYIRYTGCPIKNDPQICFCNNFGKCTLILILFSLLQQENHGTQNLSYFSHLTFIMLPLYLAKQTLMPYQCHYYVIIVFVYNLLHFNAFNHLHRLIWAK